MRRILKIAVVMAAAALALCSCAKSGPDWFKGNYSFKTSGAVYVREQGNEDAEIVRLGLPDEQGQMDILDTGGKGDGMVVTMNILSGPVVVFDAEADGKDIVLSREERAIAIRHGLAGSVVLDAGVEGTGRRYDDSVIFDLVYTGGYEEGGVMYEIVESDVECVAKLNE